MTTETHLIDVRTADTLPARRTLSDVIVRKVPGGIISAACDGVTATGMSEEVAIRELARKLELAAAR